MRPQGLHRQNDATTRLPDKRKADSSYTHVLRELVTAAQLEKAHSEELKRDMAFRNYWNTVQSWSERSRYLTTSAGDARELIAAVGDRKHGVLRWVKRHW
jgi:hypothetical protein